MEQDVDLGRLPAEAFLLVADRLDGATGHALDLALQLLVVEGAAHLAGDDDAIGRGERLAGDANVFGAHAGLRSLTEEQIDHFVGNAVTDLVRMTLGHRLAGEQIILTGHDPTP